MAKDLYVERSHTLGSEEAKRRLTPVLADFIAKYGGEGAWSGMVFSFAHPDMEGDLFVEEKRVTGQADLSLKAKLVKGQIQEEIEKLLDAALFSEEERETGEREVRGRFRSPRKDPGRGELGRGEEKREERRDVQERFTGIAPLGPRLDPSKGKEPEPKPISDREKVAIGVAIAAGTVSIALIPGPLGRVVTGILAGYSAYSITCDFIGGCRK